MEPFYGRLGLRLRAMRLKRGLTQLEVGRGIKRGKSYVSSVETGNVRVPVHVLLAWARVLRLNPNFLRELG